MQPANARVRSAITVIVITCFVAACGPTWPRPVAAVDTRLVEHTAAITRVDVLPVDLALWTDGRRGDPDALRLQAENALVGAATTALYQRGYQPGAQVRWDGSYLGDDGAAHLALAPVQLLATIQTLSGYHEAVARLGGLPQPPLPARLGASGAEATLYVGGWAFVGQAPDGGSSALKVVVIAAVVIVAVVVAVALAKSKTKVGDGLGRAAGSVADAAVATGRVAVRGLARAGNVAVEVGRTSLHLVDGLVRTFPGRVLPRMIDPSFDLYVTSRAPYGPPAWQASPAPVEWGQRPGLPRRGRSTMYLEMTLVDNRDGHVLWHVAQRFPASGAAPADVTRAAAAMLSTLPVAR
ncbi:MAG: hypothetical protein IPL61_28685 [Myxococcales bacterium]|nr:hypothetical protein [Myxococcales bacterium]